MKREQYEQWTRAADADAIGDALSQDRSAILDAPPVDTRLERELEVWDALGGMVDDDDRDDSGAMRRIVDDALAAVGQAENAPDEARPGEPATTVEAAPATRSSERASGRRASLGWKVGTAVAAAAAVAAALVLWPATVPPGATSTAVARAELVFSAGEVTVDGRAARAGDGLLEVGAEIRVVDGSACLAVDPGGDLCLGSGTTLSIAQLDGEARDFFLAEGSAIASLEKQPPGTRFRIDTAQSSSTAVGTVFAVEIAKGPGDGTIVRTTVLEGEVAVASGEDEVSVVAHQRAATTNEGSKIDMVDRSEEARWMALMGPVEFWHAKDAGSLRIDATPAGAWIFVDDRLLGAAPLTTMLPSGPHEIRLEQPGRIPYLSTVEVHAGESVELNPVLAASSQPPVPDPPSIADEKARAIDPSTARRPRTEVPAGPPGAMLADARALMSEGHWRAAVRTYEGLQKAHPNTPEAHAALVTMGDLQLDHLKRPKAALATYGRYLRKGGPMAEEVRSGRVRALRALGDARGEREAIEDFLQRHPQSLDASAHRDRLENMKRKQN